MRSCEVMVNGKLAGILTETDMPREYQFKYNHEYMADKGDPICLAMPLREEAYRSDVLFPFFFNMLSEGENRALQATLLRIDKNDDFGILMATAQHDTIGAVTVKPLTHKS